MENSKLVITLDGPAASGKSTIAKSLAKRLDFMLLPTGLLYRVLAQRNLAHRKSSSQRLSLEDSLDYTQRHANLEVDRRGVLCNGILVDPNLFTSEAISNEASRISALETVRTFLLHPQRNACSLGRVVLEGRDCGTVVWPEAQLKLFFTDSLEIRAERRWLDLIRTDLSCKYESVLQDMQERDLRDQQRDLAPMAPAPDALLFDGTNWSVDGLVRIIEWAARGAMALEQQSSGN